MGNLCFILYFSFIAFLVYVERRHWSTMTQRYEDDDDDILYSDFEYDDDDWEDEIYE